MSYFYVYVLELSNGDYYVGRSDNLKRRISEHKKGQERTTKKFLPIKLVTYLGFDTKTKAVLFEKYLKTGSGIAFKKRHFI
jgi:putative endonuclease